jgi:hypothetical protein
MQGSSPKDGADGWAKKLAQDHLSYLLGTFVLGRELSGAINGFDYQGPAGARGLASITDLIKQIGQGQADHGLERAGLGTAGILFHLPAIQVQRLIDGYAYVQENGGAPLTWRNLVTGPPPKPKH